MTRHHHGAVNAKAYAKMAGTSTPAKIGAHEKNEITALLKNVLTNASSSLYFDKDNNRVSALVTDAEQAEQLAQKKTQLRSLGICITDNDDSVSISINTEKFFQLQLDWKSIKLPAELAEIRMLKGFDAFTQDRWEVETIEPGKSYPAGSSLYIIMPEVDWNKATGIRFLRGNPENPKSYMKKIVEITNKLGGFDFELITGEKPESFAIAGKNASNESFLASVNTVLKTYGIENEKRGYYY